MAASIPVPEMRSANGFPRGLQSADYRRKYKLAIAGLARFTARIMKSIIAVMLFAWVGEAAVEPIAPPSAFSGGSAISFDGPATGTEANCLVVGGLSFGVIAAGVSANGQVIVDAGPGVTGNVNPPNLVSVANLPDLVLTVDFPGILAHQQPANDFR